MIHEKRLSALLSLGESFRDLQNLERVAPITQVSLMMGLNVLAKAALNPNAEYERATLAVFNKLRSSNCRPQDLTGVLANENKYSKSLYAKLQTDLNQILELKEQLVNTTPLDRQLPLEV